MENSHGGSKGKSAWEDEDPTSQKWAYAREWLARYGYVLRDKEDHHDNREGGRSSEENNEDISKDHETSMSQQDGSTIGGLLAFACWQGKMEACKYLYLVNEIHEKEIRYQDANGTTPMKCACAGKIISQRPF